MAAADYSSQIAVALAAIAARGVDMTLLDTPPASTAVDPDTGLPEVTQPADTEHGCVGVLLPTAYLESFGRSMLTADMRGLVHEANQGCYLAASGLGVTPAPRMRLAAAGTTYEVLGVATLAPSGTAILHELLLKA